MGEGQQKQETRHYDGDQTAEWIKVECRDRIQKDDEPADTQQRAIEQQQVVEVDFETLAVEALAPGHFYFVSFTHRNPK